MLDVHHDMIHVRNDCLYNLTLCVGGCFNGSVDTIVVNGTEQCFRKLRLRHALPAGKGDTAAAACKVNPVFADFRQQFTHADIPTDRFCLSGKSQGLDSVFLGLRITAPSAAQITAFQKDNGADTGSVVNGVALNVKNTSCSVVIAFCHRPSPFLIVDFDKGFTASIQCAIAR